MLSLWSFMKPVFWWKCHCHLEYTSSNRVKLFNCLSVPQEPLINQISSEISSDTLSGLVDSCFICICMHGFPVCIPSFCKKGKPLKPKHWLMRKLLAEVKPLSTLYKQSFLHSYTQSIHTSGDHCREGLLSLKTSPTSNCLPGLINHPPFLSTSISHWSILPQGLITQHSTSRS